VTFGLKTNKFGQVRLVRYYGCSVDGHTEATNGLIAKLFADKYRDLHTSVPYDVIEMQHIQDEVNCLLTNEPSLADCIFNFHDVQNAVSRLKTHKNDGSTGLTSNHHHVINAGDDCYSHMALLFTAIVIHGTCPTVFI